MTRNSWTTKSERKGSGEIVCICGAPIYRVNLAANEITGIFVPILKPLGERHSILALMRSGNFEMFYRGLKGECRDCGRCHRVTLDDLLNTAGVTLSEIYNRKPEERKTHPYALVEEALFGFGHRRTVEQSDPPRSQRWGIVGRYLRCRCGYNIGKVIMAPDARLGLSLVASNLNGYFGPGGLSTLRGRCPNCNIRHDIPKDHEGEIISLLLGEANKGLR